MKLIKKMKKGFTLVELVVVIAIIAILAGISVGVYIGITNSAKKSADSEIITQLNIKLRADYILEGPNKTAMEAFEDAKEIGFDLNLLKPQYGDHYVWDQKNDLFAVTKGSGENEEVVFEDPTTPLVGKNELWKRWIFTAEPSENEKRSQFYTGTKNIPELQIVSGYDDGDNGHVVELTYHNIDNVPKDVTVRTNSGGSETQFIVEGYSGEDGCDVITHYGEAGFIGIWKNGWQSFHEKGASYHKETHEGHVVIEENQIVAMITLDAKEGPVLCDIEKGASVDLLKIENNNVNPVTVNVKDDVLVKQIIGADATKLTLNVAPTATVLGTDVHDSDSIGQVVISGLPEDIPDVAPATDPAECRHQWEKREGFTVRFCKVCGTIETEHTEEEVNKETGEEQTVTYTETTILDIHVDETTGNVVCEEPDVVKENTTCEHHVYLNSSTNRLYHHCPNCGVEFGTEKYPYVLSNDLEFEAFIKLNDYPGYPGYYQVYRNDADGYKDYLYAELGNDIDCSRVEWPEGYSEAYYLIFDGKGHKLSNITNPEGCLFYYVYYWMDVENITFENCSMYSFAKYPYYGYYHDNGGYTDFYCYNLKFNDCTFCGAMFYYAYDCVITMKDCVLDGCSTNGNALISYGGYSAYGFSTGFEFYNVDIKNSESYGGAYIYYGGASDFPITFKDCNVVNTGVYGGQGMALGGFVGNASTSTVSFDGCSFDGEIVSSSATVAGFIGQPSSDESKITIKNSYISESTRIINKGGSSVYAFEPYFDHNNNGNRFLGTLSSTADSIEKSNGFTGFNYIKFNELATKDDFTFDEATGELKYIGNEEFDKITVREQVGIDDIGSGLGGYSWVFDLQDTENVTKNSSLGHYKIVNSFKQVVSEEYEGRLPFMTADKSYLDETKKVSGNGLYFSDGELAIDSRIYNDGSQFIFAGLNDADNIPSTRAIKLEILLIKDGKIEGSVFISYSVNLK